MILFKSITKAIEKIKPILYQMQTDGVVLTVKCDDGSMRFVCETMKGYSYLVETFETPFHIVTTLDVNGECKDYNAPTITEEQLRFTNVSDTTYNDEWA